MLYFLLISSTPHTHGVVSDTDQNQVPAGPLNLPPEQEELALSERTRVTPATVVCQTL